MHTKQHIDNVWLEEILKYFRIQKTKGKIFPAIKIFVNDEGEVVVKVKSYATKQIALFGIRGNDPLAPHINIVHKVRRAVAPANILYVADVIAINLVNNKDTFKSYLAESLAFLNMPSSGYQSHYPLIKTTDDIDLLTEDNVYFSKIDKVENNDIEGKEFITYTLASGLDFTVEVSKEPPISKVGRVGDYFALNSVGDIQTYTRIRAQHFFDHSDFHN